ncbi:hypothetical protein [Flavihumibacter petaseus]|uniref:Uncharacterized protein n=1 Tax=Flavihumibacter petaseus NBRC 106054 TaxID=1220578 RepID=A0A0E9N1N2_9BACT|nr:hypothetical protein [Flavihumibacter petaseus]GAO43922.1 hypothetical protein FPE01S_02_10280 [Flavihumibacter petaseus NBRC 106054]
MVTTDISQLNGECSTWRNTLRDQRSQFTSLKEKLQLLSLNLQDQKSLQDLEHLQNQFYIQLINIHDLKHAIREHEQIASWEINRNGQVSDATWSAHEELHDQYENLQHHLKNVQTEFKHFATVLQ